MRIFALLLALLLLLTGCNQIWNAGDLEKWVEQQAVRQGCDPETVKLDEWYVETDQGNVWQGTCVNKESGATMSLAINVDRVWTPSQ